MPAESGKAPSLSKSKIILKKVSCPITSYFRARSAQGYKSDPHWIVFPECCHNFWVWKKQLICLQVSQTHPKSRISIGIYSSIKAAYGCKKSSPSYQFNSFKKLSVRSPWDHLKLQRGSTGSNVVYFSCFTILCILKCTLKRLLKKRLKWLRHTEYATNICGIHEYAANICGIHKYAANICGIHEYDSCVFFWEWKKWKNNL